MFKVSLKKSFITNNFSRVVFPFEVLIKWKFKEHGK